MQATVRRGAARHAARISGVRVRPEPPDGGSARGAAPPAAGPSLKDQIGRGLQPTAQIYRTDPVATEILAIAEAEAGWRSSSSRCSSTTKVIPQLIGST
jgi:hypothetical protein